MFIGEVFFTSCSIVMSLWSSLRPEYAVMFQNLGFNDISIFEEVSFQINDILISSTEKDLYLYTHYGKMLCLKFC